ncbi:ribonuclease BN [Halobium salinum]|uniref:Ribonuclease BN n=1 Tax=Halobium salinum TaxID=1364940 RepID=A0ABD5P8M8_9EURY|nr:ribonuclease BN [Halobium salinum]
MTSLADAYTGGDRGSGGESRRLYLGVALFVVGTLLAVAGLVVGTTEAFAPPNQNAVMQLTWARHVGGLLAGVGIPAVLLGISTILPAGRRTRAAAVVGAGIAMVGVAMFWHAYPCQWSGSNCLAGQTELTLPTVGTYFLGVITTFWCLFVGVANFKTRNDPGGTVTMEVTRQGETRYVEVPAEKASGLGGIGFFGDTPDGDVKTQTNRGAVSDGGADDTDIREPQGSNARGPATTQSPSEPSSSGSLTPSSSGSSSTDAEIMRDDEPRADPTGDSYCGSCAHFDYVKTGQGMQPYCGLHDETMEDMDACRQWTPRGRGDGR